MDNIEYLILKVIYFIIIAFCMITIMGLRKKCDCYENYIETNKITTKCETYFKELKENI